MHVKKINSLLVLFLIFLLSLSAVSYGVSEDLPIQEVNDLLKSAQSKIENNEYEKAAHLIRSVNSKLTKFIFKLEPGKEKVMTDEWTMEITHYTPKASESQFYDDQYSFGLWITVNNISDKDQDVPSMTPYALNPEGWQVDGNCNFDGSEILAGAKSKANCSFNIKEKKFVAGEYRFTIKINTGTWGSPETHKLEYTIDIEAPD
ncbi:MAG: hypothetical protein ACLFVS_03270 [Candidatus Acetothermia bacterium]